MHHRSAALAVVLATIATSSALSTQRAQAVDMPWPGAVVIPSALACATQWTTVIVGTGQDDQLHGTPGNDLIIGLGGDDTIVAGAGQDTILGGEGDDVLAGGPGDDCILGGPGDDESVLWLYTVPNGTDDSHSVTFRYEY
jgi:Ca2+-binding RTX toxin-like protein